MNETLRQVLDYASEIGKSRRTLTEFQALEIAVKIQQNQVLARSFGVAPNQYESYSHPGYLEAISMSLGFQHMRDIAGAIEELSEKINDGIDRYMDNQFDA